MKNFTFFLLFFCSFSCFGQPAEYFFGSNEMHSISKMVLSQDGNFLILGRITEVNTSTLLQKMNSKGEVIWRKIISPRLQSEIWSNLKEEPDGSILISGNGIFMKTDAFGNTVWKHRYDDVFILNDFLNVDSTYILVGGYTDNPKDIGVIITTDLAGNFKSRTTHSFQFHHTLNHIFKLGAAGSSCVRVIGHTNNYSRFTPRNVFFSYPGGCGNTEFISFTSNSAIAAQGKNGSIFSIHQDHRNQLFSVIQDTAVSKLSEPQKIGSTGFTDFPVSIIQTQDGGFLIVGNANSRLSLSGIRNYAFVLKVSESGTEEWRRYYKGEFERGFTSAVQFPDGSYMLGGHIKTQQNSFKAEGWLLHVEENGNEFPFRNTGKVVLDLNENCIADPDEPGLPNWYLETNDTLRNTFVTNEDGTFIFDSGTSLFYSRLKNPNPELWHICEGEALIYHDTPGKIQLPTFLVQPKNRDCFHPKVQITQPRLLRCSTNQAYIQITNDGFATTDSLDLTITLDKSLDLKSASFPFQKIADEFHFKLSPLPFSKSIQIKLDVETDCYALLGGTYPIIAKLTKSNCSKIFEGSFFSLSGKCDGDNLVFEIKNAGNGDDPLTRYSVFADDVLLIDKSPLILPEAATEILTFPADGRTWRVELLQNPKYPHSSRPTAVVEGCNSVGRGLPSIGYYATRSHDFSKPEEVEAFPFTVQDDGDRILERVRGVSGRTTAHNFFEYTAVATNHEPHPIESAVFTLYFRGLNPFSFRPLASSEAVRILSMTAEEVTVTVENLNLAPGEDVALSFKIQPDPKQLINPSSWFSFYVFGNVRFKNSESYPLNYTSTRYSEILQFPNDKSIIYPENTILFGNAGTQTGTRIRQASDGSIYIVGTTNDFNDYRSKQGMVVKIDSTGKGIYVNSIVPKVDTEDYTEDEMSDVVPLPDGGCIVGLNRRTQGTLGGSRYYSTETAYLARLDSLGKQLWIKKLAPPFISSGLDKIAHLLPAADGNILAVGEDHVWAAKFSPEGDSIWINQNNNRSQESDGLLVTESGDLVSAQAWAVGPGFEIYRQDETIFDTVIWMDNSPSVISGFCHTPDSSYLIAGTYNKRPCLLKFSNNFELVFAKHLQIDSTASEIIPTGMVADPNGGYFICGRYLHSGTPTNHDFMLLKIDENGEVLKTKIWGNESDEKLESIVLSEDKLWLCGTALADAVLIRLDIKKDDLSKVDFIAKEEGQVLVFPNPAENVSNVILSPAPIQNIIWDLYDFTGKKVAEGETQTGGFSISLDGLNAGNYLLVFPEGTYSSTQILKLN